MSQQTEIEIWKPVPGYADLYEASSLGRVRGKAGRLQGKIITGSICKRKGYYKLALMKNGEAIQFRLHRLIALTFIENPIGYDQVNHKDGNKANNRVDNLEWCNNSQNQKHAFATGLNSHKGVKNSKAILSEAEVLHIRALSQSGSSDIELSKSFSVARCTINHIVHKRTWQHI